jgi:hypothetical protein
VTSCHIGLGKLYRRKGDLRLTKENLSDGIAMMREMEMGLWLERAEAELKELVKRSNDADSVLGDAGLVGKAWA